MMLNRHEEGGLPNSEGAAQPSHARLSLLPVAPILGWSTDLYRKCFLLPPIPSKQLFP